MTTSFTPGIVKETTGELHVYADGTSGDDNNSGLTVGSPKKTLQAVFDLVPFLVKHNTCIHLSGVFDTSGVNVLLRRIVDGFKLLLIDGGSSLTTVADNGGSPWAADISSTSSIGLTTAGWAVDAYMGYLVEVISGPAAGQHRMIQGNTATTITPGQNFSVDPGAGATFRISRPATEIRASGAVNTFLYLHCNTAWSSPNTSSISNSTLKLQRLYLSGSRLFAEGRNGCGFSLTQVISDATSTFTISAHDCVISAQSWYDDPVTFLMVNTPSGPRAGLSLRGVGSYLNIHRAGPSSLSSSVCTIRLSGSAAYYISTGSRIPLFTVVGFHYATMDISNSIQCTAGYAPTKLGKILLQDSAIRIGAGVDISNCSSHAIECNHSRLHLDGAVTGSGNTGAGVYAHSGSVVHIKDGAPPTLTGGVGDLSVDGTTQVSTWAAIDGGTPVASLAEMTMAKQVP